MVIMKIIIYLIKIISKEKINSLTSINSILKSIKTGKSKLTFQEFCENCRKYKILHILDDKNIHEEIIKRLPDIIYIIYQYNFGYEKSEENEEKIKSDKKLIFDVLFNKLLESEQNNEKLVKNIQNIICDFCQILNEEDKINVYNDNYIMINKLDNNMYSIDKRSKGYFNKISTDLQNLIEKNVKYYIESPDYFY